jgi:hypothetical protein
MQTTGIKGQFMNWMFNTLKYGMTTGVRSIHEVVLKELSGFLGKLGADSISGSDL